jgi:hypothetical protein
MAQEVIIELKAETEAARKQIEALTNEVSELRKEQAQQSKEALTQAKETAKGVGGISKSFKTLGNALKAAGIGLAIAAFAKLSEVFMQNQKAADFFNTAFEAVSIAFNDFVSFIIDNTGGVIKFFESIFTNPLDSLKNFADAFKKNIQERFESYLDTLGYLASAVKKVFSGDFAGALDDVKSAGKESLDVLTGVNNSFEKGKEILNDAVDAVVEYGKETIKTAAANVQLANNAELAAAQQSRLVEQYDRQAEQLRQIRDDERFSIEERRKANDELLQVLAEQEAAMLKQADAQVASAQANLAKNKSIENQVALTDALANKEGVLAQIEGLRSEQKANDLALDREENELINSKLESESKLAIERERFNAEQIDDEILKLERLKEIALQEQEQEQARLQNIIDNANAGTQAKADAQIALNEFMEQSRQANIEADTALAATSKAIEEKALADKIAIIQAEQSAREANLQTIANGLNGLQQVFAAFGKESKALAIASIIVDQVASVSRIVSNTGIANAQALAISPLTFGQPWVTINTISAAASIAGSIASAGKSIAALKGNKKTPLSGSALPSPSAGGGGGVTAASQAPQFNIIGGGAENQLAGLLADQTQKPLKAYVVSNEVTTAQSLDRNIVESATLG